MTMDLEFLTPADKPALLGLNTPQFVEAARTALLGLGYKIHTAINHGDFFARFTRIQYQIIFLEELFDSGVPEENLTLQNLQMMPMNQRRHTAILLLGDSFQTLNTMQSFCQSVHAVINRGDLEKLPQIVQQVVSDNDLFLNVYRETSIRAAQGKT
jgi:hypothetical protein